MGRSCHGARGRLTLGCDALNIRLLYHYFHPDDVISARLFSDLGVGLSDRGWTVEASACNRGCRDESRRHPLRETWRGIGIRRVWRPPLRQASNLGRLINTAWMMGAWSAQLIGASRVARPDLVLLGTDPQLGLCLAAAVRRLRPSIRLVHWCHDVHPEAIVAMGLIRETSPLFRLSRRGMRAGYAACDLIADLGPCMRERLTQYDVPARHITVTPWALCEPTVPAPPDPPVRHELFGDARLGLLYTGNFGQAHTADRFLDLARTLRREPIMFCFAARGNRVDHLRASVTDADLNVRFGAFAEESQLPRHLSAADVHLASLRPEWTGLVVPSKFFGSLAAGRPVLFAGSPESSLARWIRQYRVGWVLDEASLPVVAMELRQLAAHPAGLQPLFERCHRVYQQQFSKAKMIAHWDLELQRLVNPSPVC